MITTVLTTDVVNDNNTIYPKHVVQMALVKCKGRLAAHDMPVKDIRETSDNPVGRVRSFRLVGDKVIASIELTDPRMVESFNQGDLYASLCGVGYLSEHDGHSIVEKFDIQGVTVAKYPPPKVYNVVVEKLASEAVPDQEEI